MSCSALRTNEFYLDFSQEHVYRDLQELTSGALSLTHTHTERERERERGRERERERDTHTPKCMHTHKQSSLLNTCMCLCMTDCMYSQIIICILYALSKYSMVP